MHDAGQEVHFEKDRRNSQYLFARLEARAIQRLVALDMEAGKIAAEESPPRKRPRRKRQPQRPLARITRQQKPPQSPQSDGNFLETARPKQVPRDFSYLAGLRDFRVHQQVHRDGQSGRGAELFFSAGRRHHLGGDGFWHPAAIIRISASTATSIQHPPGIRISRSMAADLSTTRTATARTSRASSPANGACRRTRRKEIPAAARGVALSEEGHRGRRIPADAARWYQRDGAAMQAC